MIVAVYRSGLFVVQRMYEMFAVFCNNRSMKMVSHVQVNSKSIVELFGKE